MALRNIDSFLKGERELLLKRNSHLLPEGDRLVPSGLTGDRGLSLKEGGHLLLKVGRLLPLGLRETDSFIKALRERDASF